MPGVTWDTFERYQQKGLDARRAGQWDSARIYLLEAARAMVELSKDAQGEELQAKPAGRWPRSCSSWPRTAKRPRARSANGSAAEPRVRRQREKSPSEKPKASGLAPTSGSSRKSRRSASTTSRASTT